MIGDFLFFIKMVFLTLFLVLALQVKIGTNTVEEHTMQWAASSPMLQPLKEVAHGGVIAIKKGWGIVVTSLGGKVSGIFNKESLPGHRTIGVKLERSKKYIKEKLDQQVQSAQNTIEDYDGVVDVIEEEALPGGEEPSTY